MKTKKKRIIKDNPMTKVPYLSTKERKKEVGIIKDNPVTPLDRIKLGKKYPTDSTMYLDSKEYGIESKAWNIISLLKNNNINTLLNYIYKNFDKDLIQSVVETNNEQPKTTICKNPYGKGRIRGPYCKVTKGICKCFSNIPDGKIRLMR